MLVTVEASVEVPDDVAAELEAQRPALEGCARRAVEEFAARAQELRRHDEALLSRLTPASPPVRVPLDDEPALLTVPRAAKILGTSVDHLKALIRAERIPSVNLSLGEQRSHLMVPAEAIRSLVASAGT